MNDQGFVTHNGLTSLDTFLAQLQDEAFDTMKLSMMEASIRQFHLIAADADVRLTRRLCSVKSPNVAEKRLALIEEHKVFMEAQASSLLTDMNALHDQLKEQHTMVSRGLFDIPVDEDGRERPLPPSTVPWKNLSPPIHSKSSHPWKPTSSSPGLMEVPKPQARLSEPILEPESTMPSFWKPSWDANQTDPLALQVPPISKSVTVEDVLDESEADLAAPPQVWKNARTAQVPVQQPAPMKNQMPGVPDEPTPVWGHPWRKGQSSLPHACYLFTHEVTTGKPSVSDNSSNQATKPAQVSLPLYPVVERPPTPPPVTYPTPETASESAPTPSRVQTRVKTAKQSRAEKSRKGKNKAATAVTKEEVEEKEEVPTLQPPVSRKIGIDVAIDDMVHTGNFQSALEQILRA